MSRELLTGEAKRGALEGDLAAELGAALATSAPAQLVQVFLGVGEALLGSGTRLLELAAACSELARGRTVEGLDLVDCEWFSGRHRESSGNPLGNAVGLPASGKLVRFVGGDAR